MLVLQNKPFRPFLMFMVGTGAGNFWLLQSKPILFGINIEGCFSQTLGRISPF